MKKIINEKQQQFPKRFYKNVVCLLITIIFMLSSYGCTTEKSVKNSSYNINEKVSFYYEDNDIPVKSDIEDARSFESSMNNGSVMLISTSSSYKLEVYNIQELDKFIECFNNGKGGYVRIIKGKLIDDEFLVNELMELECDDKKVVKLTPYDPYKNKDKFTSGESKYFDQIIKLTVDDGSRYVVVPNKNTDPDMALTLISFDNDCIKNKKK